MSIVNTLALESNRQIKINFDGGNLSSDAGLLLIKEFISKLGIDNLLGTALNSATGILYPFWRLVERCLGYMGQFWDSWYSYQFRYCSMNNSGYSFFICKIPFHFLRHQSQCFCRL